MALPARLERVLHSMGRAGPLLHALSALDIALWDVRGKLEGRPVHALLGGKRRERVAVYASLLRYGGVIEQVKRNVARALERGYRQIKLHKTHREAVAATRTVTGPDIPIMVDMNCAWLPDAAVAAVAAMAPSKPLWVEEPVWPPEDFDAMAAVRRATGVALAAGENATGVLDFKKMIAAGAVDYRAAERDQDRWHHRAVEDRDRIRSKRRHLRAARALFRPGLSRLGACARRQRARSALERFFCDLALMPYTASVPVVEWLCASAGSPALAPIQNPN